VTNAEELTQVEAEIAAISATLLKIYAKTNQSVSFGDQTYSLANAKMLEDARDRLRQRRKNLESALAGGTPRRTIKIGFPSC
jgi:hypothetical protein